MVSLFIKIVSPVDKPKDLKNGLVSIIYIPDRAVGGGVTSLPTVAVQYTPMYELYQHPARLRRGGPG